MANRKNKQNPFRNFPEQKDVKINPYSKSLKLLTLVVDFGVSTEEI